ncbi:MAG: ribulose-phosphate 3-epimerase [FCB group bacterium]|nr:ribulose-phosphate 3-epimerase [FCB group bacterium]MBL7028764.1 ribulose-phosphate 3-epimerase [Candidatus Neomarinimicrobiota bacterium]MBL7121352.1 ribulose-phosphate 3-epimerase [Candidatus Neomarinimicrobiota bacterium]
MTAQISPSVLSADFSRLGDQIKSVAESGGEVLHLDVMDGHYVPNLTFGPLLVKAMRKMTDMVLEAHLMISEPDLYIENFIKAGADIVLVHPSTCSSVQDTLRNIKTLGAKAGLVVNPDEKLSIIDPYLGEIDQLLIMSVVPGFGGQSFMPEVLDDLPQMRQALVDNNVLVEIDGGINKTTIASVLGKGISRFVAGSAVFNKHASPGENFNTLQTLVTAGK